MPKIIPIKELKNTAKISLMVRESPGPVYVTKNGYDDMVIMRTEDYDQLLWENDILEKLLEGEQSLARGEGVDAFESLAEIRKKYGI